MGQEKFPTDAPSVSGSVPTASGKVLNVQKVYEQSLKFQPGQSVTIYVGGAKYSFPNVATLRVNVVDSALVIVTASRVAVFRNWDGVEVGNTAQSDGLELRG